MRKIASYIIYTILIACIACACSDNLDINQSYQFEVAHLPVPKKVKKGETIEIRCQLKRSGRFENTRYFMRYFQPDGIGILKMDDIAFKPNDQYDLTKEIFRLYYTSESEDQQTIDVYFFDNFGNNQVLNFSFNNDNSKEE